MLAFDTLGRIARSSNINVRGLVDYICFHPRIVHSYMQMTY